MLLEKELPLESLEKIEIYYSQNLIDMIGINSVKMYVEKIEINYLSHISPK